ncbi:NTP transferase domain-containing protein [Haloarchaeobius iranensis]|uniref:Adenosylcobinamide-phosphate guanylyltransferase n=1 Tax=Haloarchaeobius iranensis TaxID=996166 RepID=A0A1G9YE26_9EURY|nr:NTP transferase domain-containing protein [Haloarchaeobius iranensis]SDN07458.1 adenosylcobinamide-phosphate guanylyltransferase [Haloarchaeobius iranensis]
MCGGEGTRFDGDVEKPLFRVGGVPMVDRVCDALAASQVEDLHAAVSPNAPCTRDHLVDRSGVTTVETPGEGYVADLGSAIEATGGEPVLTVAADLPLLAAGPVDRALDAAVSADGTVRSLSVVVPVALKEQLGVSVDTAMDGVAPTGVNVVGPETESETHVSFDARLAVNANTAADAAVAARLVGEVGTDGP